MLLMSHLRRLLKLVLVNNVSFSTAIQISLITVLSEDGPRECCFQRLFDCRVANIVAIVVNAAMWLFRSSAS
jgi:hypothetical protein